MSNEVTIKSLMKRDEVQKKFEELLGKKAQGFISSVLQVVNRSKHLKSADPKTVLNAAATAAILDLPIDPNLGFAWIVPYKGQAQFQIGWKGFVQLAQRTGQYHRINVVEVYENQFKSYNVLTEELDADFMKDAKGDVVGYAAYFKLTNNFEKLVFWTKSKVIAHAKKYSKSYGSSLSPWSDEDQFGAMAKKTVLKNTLSKWGIMSIEFKTAVMSDQAVQNEAGKYRYVDNQKDDNGNTLVMVSNEEVLLRIQGAETLDCLIDIEADYKPIITKDVHLVAALGEAKSKFQ